MNNHIYFVINEVYLKMKIIFRSISVLSSVISLHVMASDRIEDSIDQKTDVDLVRCVPPTQFGVAARIIKPVYEQGHRNIREEHKYGQSFPINPEMLHELMTHVRGTEAHVLEIAGAAGQNAVMLGLAGAERVYHNDIVPSEVEAFEAHVSTLAPDQQKKFTPICGDCFELGDHIPSGSLDVILARNIVHFFKESQYEAFFSMVKGLLKPGGRFAMTVNSHYNLTAEGRAGIPEGEIRLASEMLIRDVPGQRPEILARMTSVSEVDGDPLDYKICHIKVGRGTILADQKFDTISGAMKTKVGSLVEANLQGSFRVLTNTLMYFTPTSLTKLVEAQGLEVISAGHIGGDGHAISDAVAKEQGAVFVSLMARMPEDSVAVGDKESGAAGKAEAN